MQNAEQKCLSKIELKFFAETTEKAASCSKKHLSNLIFMQKIVSYFFCTTVKTLKQLSGDLKAYFFMRMPRLIQINLFIYLNIHYLFSYFINI